MTIRANPMCFYLFYPMCFYLTIHFEDTTTDLTFHLIFTHNSLADLMSSQGMVNIVFNVSKCTNSGLGRLGEALMAWGKQDHADGNKTRRTAGGHDLLKQETQVIK